MSFVETLKAWGCKVWLPLNGNTHDMMNIINPTNYGASIINAKDGKKYYSLDGVDDYVNIPSVPEISGMSTFSMNFNLYLPKYCTDTDLMISKLNQDPTPTSLEWYVQVKSNGVLSIYIYQLPNSYTSKISFETTTSVPLNEFLNIGISCTTNNIKVYINSNEVSGTLSGSITSVTATNQPVIIGKQYGKSTYMAMKIKDFILTTSFLTQKQHQAIMKETFIE